MEEPKFTIPFLMSHNFLNFYNKDIIRQQLKEKDLIEPATFEEYFLSFYKNTKVADDDTFIQELEKEVKKIEYEVIEKSLYQLFDLHNKKETPLSKEEATPETESPASQTKSSVQEEEKGSEEEGGKEEQEEEQEEEEEEEEEQEEEEEEVKKEKIIKYKYNSLINRLDPSTNQKYIDLLKTRENQEIILIDKGGVDFHELYHNTKTEFDANINFIG